MVPRKRWASARARSARAAGATAGSIWRSFSSASRSERRLQPLRPRRVLQVLPHRDEQRAQRVEGESGLLVGQPGIRVGEPAGLYRGLPLMFLLVPFPGQDQREDGGGGRDRHEQGGRRAVMAARAGLRRPSATAARRAHRPGVDRLAGQEAAQVVGQVSGAGVAAAPAPSAGTSGRSSPGRGRRAGCSRRGRHRARCPDLQRACPATVAPWNGGRPVSSSYRMAPRA